jgi:signal transduction histidine kinase
MDESWDWVEQELKKIQDDMPQDAEMMQVVDAISVADFWKRRYDEERMLWERKLETKEDEKKNLKDKAQVHEMSIKELDYRFKELERRWEQEKLMLEDRLKSSEIESSLEKAQLMWESRLKVLEEENKSMKLQLGVNPDNYLHIPQQGIPGKTFISTPAADAARREMENHLKEREEIVRKNEEEAKKRLEALEAEKNQVANVMAEKEKALNAAKEKWDKLEKDLGRMSTQMRQQLDNLKDREEDHFVILEDLARGFAHRVRNYLGIISGTMQLSLANFKMEPELEEQLKIVDLNVQDMLKSIEDFLSLARIPEMNMQPVNLNQLTDAAIASFGDRFRADNITVSRNYAAEMPSFKGDQKLLSEGLRHLMENSIEAMPQGGQFTVTTTCDTVKGIISLRVADTGLGITDNHIKKVFQPYFTSKKKHKGLGLTIAKRIIDLHRGTLAVNSATGQGTAVSINLFLEA